MIGYFFHGKLNQIVFALGYETKYSSSPWLMNKYLSNTLSRMEE